MAEDVHEPAPTTACSMLQPIVLVIGLIPLVLKFGPLLLPDNWLEPYAYWDIASLNRIPGQDGPVRQWRNMGSWRGIEVYPEAAEQLARRLLEFADAKPGGRVLALELAVAQADAADLAHGAGESLLLHLSQDPPPASLVALTSLKQETLQAQQLVESRFSNAPCPIEWYTQSASFHPSSTSPKNLAHPLNPMKGYMGETADLSDEAEEADDEVILQRPDGNGFDLIYILDSIYHFPPAIPHFLTTAISSLSPGGVIAYTDVLAPADLSTLMGYWVLPTVVGVPARNLLQRPKTLDEYKQQLLKIGYAEVEIEDWSEDVFPGFAKFLKARGGMWPLVGRGVDWALTGGWRYVAVRAQKAL